MKNIILILFILCFASAPVVGQTYNFFKFVEMQGNDQVRTEKGTLTIEGEYLTFRSQTINFKMLIKGETKKGAFCSVFHSLCKDYFKIHYTNEGGLKTIFIKKGGKMIYFSKNMML